ncbi:MAG: PAS domain S-box protein [Candidatus Heimdallarchaeota archaeon]|nr:PAS domain S-box protein [Candidatus Heimdallarchaeota archaeon]
MNSNDLNNLQQKIYALEQELDHQQTILSYMSSGVNNSSMLLWIVGNDGIIIHRDGGLKLNSMFSKKSLGKSIDDVMAEYPEVLKLHQEALDGKEIKRIEPFRIKGSDKILYINLSLTPQFDSAGKVKGIVGTAFDVSPLQEAKQLYSEAEERYEAIFEGSPLGILIIDQAICQYANTTVKKMFGYPENFQMKGMNSVEFFAPSVREIIYQRSLRRQQGEDEPISYETLGQHRSGKIFPVQVFASNFQYRGRSLVMGFIYDLTELKQLEREKNTLENQLFLSQKLETLGIVAETVAHDLNNLLVGILGNASILEMEFKPDHPQILLLKEIQNITKEAAELVKQMASYTNTAELRKTKCNIKDLVEDIEKLIRITIPRSIEINYFLEEVGTTFLADISQIQQLLMNLIVNASEALSEQGGKIEVISGLISIDEKLRDELLPGFRVKPGQYIFLKVRDNGPGIAEETMQEVFEPFFTTKMSGRGIGLSVVKSIVKKHNGGIRMQSTASGTCFTMYFPVSDPVIQVINEVIELPKGRVLFCDDDHRVQRVGTKMLKKLGFEPLIANNGKEALEIIERNTDIILLVLDLTMPVLNGRDTLFKLRESGNNMPVIISSGYIEVDTVLDLHGIDRVEFLQKPYLVGHLEEAMAKLL